ncbi:hypothetical protein [Paenibacillus sp. FSL K6-2859]|uniref:hypothetical protein n=1 Tax=Paenibacillus sp. FSL K6-2859 TaxID=2921482 RepID=UPI0030FB875C
MEKLTHEFTMRPLSYQLVCRRLNAGLQHLSCNLIELTLYEVRVPQTGDLLLASFRFDLAVDTLTLSQSLIATTAFAIQDFNPIDSAHAGRT